VDHQQFVNAKLSINGSRASTYTIKFPVQARAADLVAEIMVRILQSPGNASNPFPEWVLGFMSDEGLFLAFEDDDRPGEYVTGKPDATLLLLPNAVGGGGDA
jgi:hypothetical protein